MNCNSEIFTLPSNIDEKDLLFLIDKINNDINIFNFPWKIKNVNIATNSIYILIYAVFYCYWLIQKKYFLQKVLTNLKI